MNAFFPILAAILQASSFTLDKFILSLKRITYRGYIGLSFPLTFFVTLVIFLIFRPPLPGSLFSGTLLWLLLASVGMVIVTNLIFYRALEDDSLGEIQTIDLLHNIPIIIVSALLFSDERRYAVVIPALIASLAIVWSHWRHHHFKIATHTLPFLVWSLVTAPFGAAISKTLLAVWHPISLELVRNGALTLTIGSAYRRHSKNVPVSAFWPVFITNILTSIAWILFYFSYQRSGIVYTVLLFSLQPLLVYIGALLFLREKFQWKKFVAFVVVLGSIITAQILA